MLANSHAREIDLLVTWLYRLTQEQQDYKMASVIGIMVFVVCAVFTLIAFNLVIGRNKEDKFQI
jgi:arabinogalactan oligomer/maltooligosaccharide transport system permease protein